MTDHTTSQSSANSAPLGSSHAGMAGGNEVEGGDEIDLGALFQALKEGWRLPVLLGGIAAFLAVVVVLLSKPVFDAGGSLYLGSAEKSQSVSSGALSGFSLLSGLMQGSSMATQVDIVRSRSFVEQAILDSGINTEVWQAGDQPGVHFWNWLLGGHSLSIYAPPSTALHAVLADVTDPSLAKTKLTVHFSSAGHYQITKGKQVVLQGQLGQPAVGPGIRLELRAVNPQYIPQSQATYRLSVQTPRSVYNAMTRNGTLGVSQLGGSSGGTAKTTYIVSVNYRDTDPVAAQQFVQALMHTYLAKTHSWATGQAGATYDYLSAQMHKIRTALSAADTRLAQYQAQSGVIAVSAGAQALIKQEAEYETQRSQFKLQLYALQQLSRQISTPNAQVNPYILSSIHDPVLDKLSGRLAAAQTKLSSLEKLYTPAAPQVVQILAEIQSIQSATSNLIDNQEKSAQQQLQSLDTLISQYQGKMGKFPQAELKVISLTRSSEVLGKLYMFLLQKQEEAAINKASTITKNRILDTALVHDKPVTPKAKEDVILFGLLGIFLGLGLVLGRFLMHPGFRSDEELRRHYPFLPLYGLLPVSGDVSLTKRDGFQLPEARSGFGEAIRLLRSNLYLATAQGHGQILMASSATPQDGKSTVSYQLAAALAQDGKKVMVIDADLRKPHIHEVFRIAQAPGLAGILAGRHSWQESVRQIKEPNVDLITAGNIPPNPSEYIGTDHFAQMLTEMRPLYDYILLDTPPFPMVGDSLLLGRQADRILTVVRVNGTPRKAFKEHLQGLMSLEKPLGLIINGIRVNATYGYGYGYHYGEPGPAVKGWRRMLRGWLQKLWG
ncbi:polysaccharide biosynthesis tyrosine autokinase [Acidithiobacillus sp.]|uniref:polysaccharide biosynthesis tyrosine autokinase n=1 Tax=Acidithiobacillus sp. TaxID=1872118 RepID=UPI0025C245DE|nr:polysaccharide biosynthesis tyrosine autokinase [Acidithiobacillus sp.]